MIDRSHRRFNPLTGRWVLLSPQRLKRPWQGHVEDTGEAPLPAYDPGCYLCPGNVRANGHRNPGYEGTYVFTNDFAALEPADPEDNSGDSEPLFRQQAASGMCRVVCYSPDHSRTLPLLAEEQLIGIVKTWRSETQVLSQKHAAVTVFENKGAMMGCSNPHPHGQIWASTHVPDELLVEDQMQRAYRDRHGQPMLLDVAQQERGIKDRIVCQTSDWLAIVPFWASWPFETLILPLSPLRHLDEITDSAAATLAELLRDLMTRYDNLFRCSFPYSMGWHGAPFLQSERSHWTLHAHVYPPLLRSASVRKFMVGYEMLAEAQRDLTPEAAAEMLRAQTPAHYRLQESGTI